MSNEKSMSSVMFDMDDICSRIEIVKNLLQVFDEGLEREVSLIDSNEPWTAACFMKRYGLLDSQLFAISALLCDVLDDARESVNVGFKILRDQEHKEGSAV